MILLKAKVEGTSLKKRDSYVEYTLAAHIFLKRYFCMENYLQKIPARVWNKKQVNSYAGKPRL